MGSAERILKLGELCRKLETEQEKVLPFCSPEEALDLHPPADQQDRRHMEAEGSASATALEEADHQVHTAPFSNRLYMAMPCICLRPYHKLYMAVP